uniref:Uncharacterized protein n=1 Tax=Sphaerodactylus townsendi TaxID=933632 RepID=A0ACB8G3H2_9SAUR
MSEDGATYGTNGVVGEREPIILQEGDNSNGAGGTEPHNLVKAGDRDNQGNPEIPDDPSSRTHQNPPLLIFHLAVRKKDLQARQEGHRESTCFSKLVDEDNSDMEGDPRYPSTQAPKRSPDVWSNSDNLPYFLVQGEAYMQANSDDYKRDVDQIYKVGVPIEGEVPAWYIDLFRGNAPELQSFNLFMLCLRQ